MRRMEIRNEEIEKSLYEEAKKPGTQEKMRSGAELFHADSDFDA